MCILFLYFFVIDIYHVFQGTSQSFDDFSDDYGGTEFTDNDNAEESPNEDQMITSFDTIEDVDFDKLGKFYVLDAANGDGTEI